MGDPSGFLKLKRVTPQRRPVQLRVRDWQEFYDPMTRGALREQGARCMDCGVPFCQGDTGCPVLNLIPEWNDLVYRDRWQDALTALHATNNFPEFTGRLCPAPCEGACVLGIIDDPVSIKNIEQAIIDRGFAEGWVTPLPPAAETGKRVAVVGSGPAGLAAAQQLRRMGHSVVLFEKDDRIGGLLRYGIPDFKLEKWVLDRRLEQMEAEGVEFVTGVEVGVDLPVEQLRAEFDAICLTGGAQVARELPVEGRDLAGTGSMTYPPGFASALTVQGTVSGSVVLLTLASPALAQPMTMQAILADDGRAFNGPLTLGQSSEVRKFERGR